MDVILKNLNFKSNYSPFIAFLAIFVIVEFVNLITGRLLTQFGLIPRQFDNIIFVFTSPFVHASVGHFLSNIITLAIFSYLLFLFNKKHFFANTFIIIIASGIGVWLFGRNATHLGASGLVYGYFGFLLLAGWVSKRIGFIVISIVVLMVYGSMIWGVLPSPRGYISWEYHLFGFLSGLALANFQSKSAPSQ